MHPGQSRAAMKLFPSIISAGAVCVLAFHPARSSAQPAAAEPVVPEAADDGDEHEGPVAVSIMEEVFSLPLADADNLLHDVPSDRLRYARLREMLAGGKARLEKLMVLRTKSGQRAVVESVHELIYPSEFDAPKPPAPANSADGADKAPPKVENSFPINPTTPTAFEKRNIGDTLEVEPVVGPDGMTIDLNLVPQSVRYLGDRTIDGPHPVKQPIFETGKVTTSVSVRDGQPYFLATVHPALANGFPGQQKEQRVWLEFLTVNLVRFERIGLSKGAAAMVARAQKMRLAKLDFRETSIFEAAEFLHKQSVELDPEKQGLHFVLKAPPNLLQTKITLSLKGVSLLEAAREVAKRAALIVEPEDSALLLRAAGENP